MRQAGIVAAGGLYALDHHVERLADDHANARGGWPRASPSCRASTLDPATVETNIVDLRASPTPPAFCARAGGATDVAMGPLGAAPRARGHPPRRRRRGDRPGAGGGGAGALGVARLALDGVEAEDHDRAGGLRRRCRCQRRRRLARRARRSTRPPAALGSALLATRRRTPCEAPRPRGTPGGKPSHQRRLALPALRVEVGAAQRAPGRVGRDALAAVGTPTRITEAHTPTLGRPPQAGLKRR